jgi:hypothetical protein
MKIQDKGMIAYLNISTWTARKFDPRVTREIEASYAASNSGRYNKILIATEYLANIQKIASAARKYHYENTLPWFDNGGRLLPAANYFVYVQKIDEYRNEFVREVDKFLALYPGYKEEARSRLNGMFAGEDYPEPDALKGKYRLGIQLHPIPDADDFRVTLNEEDVEAIREAYRQQLENSVAEANKELWSGLYEVVGHMLERLSTADARFKNSLVENVRDICELMPRLNVSGDEQLNAMVAEVQETLAGLSPDALRRNAELRGQTATQARRIMDKMQHYQPLPEAA